MLRPGFFLRNALNFLCVPAGIVIVVFRYPLFTGARRLGDALATTSTPFRHSVTVTR